MKKILLILNENPIDPLGIMYLIGNVEAKFDVVFIKDINDPKLSQINIFDYDILGFSTITGSHLFHNEIVKHFKSINPNILTMMGGPHPTFFPEESLSLSHIDYVCIGEGIFALNNFIKGLATKNIINDYSQYSTERDPIVNINEMKIDRSVVYSKDNRGDNLIKNFMGTFFCPFNCSYCFNKSYRDLYKQQSDKTNRYVDPQIFIQQIKDCVNTYPTKFIYIQDDTFILNKSWFTEVTNLIKSEVNFPYHCHIRCNLVTEDIIKQLKRTGCKSVTFAVENADHEYRKKFLNRSMTNETILNTATLLHKYEIEFRIENIVGLPFNDIRENLNTMKLNAKCKPTIGWASLFQPFPNTELGSLCVKDKLWSGDLDSINPGFFDKSPMNIKNKIQIERIQKLFSLGVNNFWMRIFIKILIWLPLDDLYKKWYTIFKNKQYMKLYDYK